MPAFIGLLGVAIGASFQYISEERKRTHDDKKDLEKRIHDEKKDILKKRGELYGEFLKKLGECVSMLSDHELLKPSTSAEEVIKYRSRLMDSYRSMRYTVSEMVLFANPEIGSKSKELCSDYFHAVTVLQTGLEKPREEIIVKVGALLIKIGNSQRELEFDMNRDIAPFSEEELKRVR